jgi:hypothetical protein
MPWSNWESLGGNLTSIPSVASNEDGRLEVFAIRTDQTLYHIWQNAPNGQWDIWHSLGGMQVDGDPPSVASNEDGHLEVFVRGVDHYLHHIWQNAPNGQWVSWQSFNANMNHLKQSVTSYNDGRLAVFIVAADGYNWYRVQDDPNGQWRDWQTLGSIYSVPEAARNEDGRLEVFVTAWQDGHGQLYHIWELP